MEQSRIDRINALSRLARERELTCEEAAERQALREEYVAAFRQSLTATLENTYIVDEAGNKKKLQKRNNKPRK